MGGASARERRATRLRHVGLAKEIAQLKRSRSGFAAKAVSERVTLREVESVIGTLSHVTFVFRRSHVHTLPASSR